MYSASMSRDRERENDVAAESTIKQQHVKALEAALPWAKRRERKRPHLEDEDAVL